MGQKRSEFSKKDTGFTAMKTRKIGLVNYLAYGSGDFLGAGTTALTAAWLLYFYTTFCGLSPIEATLIFATARVLDAVISPLMGFLTDNFGSTWLGNALADVSSLFCSASPACSATPSCG
jgi:hypothetical protein